MSQFTRKSPPRLPKIEGGGLANSGNIRIWTVFLKDMASLSNHQFQQLQFLCVEISLNNILLQKQNDSHMENLLIYSLTDNDVLTNNINLY